MAACYSGEVVKIQIVKPQYTALFFALLAALFLDQCSDTASAVTTPGPIAEFNQNAPKAWFSSTPLSVADLRDKVLLINFWSYSCWSCCHSFSWLKSLEAKFAEDNCKVIGIHTPEFEHEKNSMNVS